tara:strand:- start:1620 stop:1877 length:258 start_codon:yes stop_codon:yes gene_type:complete
MVVSLDVESFLVMLTVLRGEIESEEQRIERCFDTLGRRRPLYTDEGIERMREDVERLRDVWGATKRSCGLVLRWNACDQKYEVEG